MGQIFITYKVKGVDWFVIQYDAASLSHSSSLSISFTGPEKVESISSHAGISTLLEVTQWVEQALRVIQPFLGSKCGWCIKKKITLAVKPGYSSSYKH